MAKKNKIPVIFRKIDGFIDAILPTMAHSYGTVLTYCRNEGYNEADYLYAIKGRLATEDEYTPLFERVSVLFTMTMKTNWLSVTKIS